MVLRVNRLPGEIGMQKHGPVGVIWSLPDKKTTGWSLGKPRREQ